MITYDRARDHLLAELALNAKAIEHALAHRDDILERARRLGVPVREIAHAAGIAPQTVLNILNRRKP